MRRWGGELRPRYRRALPLVVAGTLAAWAGAWVEILRPARGKLGVLLADQRPGKGRQAGSADEDGLSLDDRRGRAVAEAGESEGGVDEPELLQRRT